MFQVLLQTENHLTILLKIKQIFRTVRRYNSIEVSSPRLMIRRKINENNARWPLHLI